MHAQWPGKQSSSNTSQLAGHNFVIPSQTLRHMPPSGRP